MERWVTKVKALFSGVGVAVVAGLLLGGAMKPNLAGDDRPEGPQMLLGWSGARSTGPFDDGMAFAAYRGQTPDYVIGTDWRQNPVVAQDVAYEPAPSADYYAEAVSDRASYPATTYVEPPREPPVYPSVSGGAAYGEQPRPHDPPKKAEAPRPAEPAQAQFDDDAPPEATGDTTRVPS